MKRETKLWLRKSALMALRAIIWHADEWLHAQETKLREELACVGDTQSARGKRHLAGSSIGLDRTCLTVSGDRVSPRRARETFQQWEARRSGIAVVTKKEARRRRAITASAFDLRFAR